MEKRGVKDWENLKLESFVDNWKSKLRISVVTSLTNEASDHLRFVSLSSFHFITSSCSFFFLLLVVKCRRNEAKGDWDCESYTFHYLGSDETMISGKLRVIEQLFGSIEVNSLVCLWSKTAGKDKFEFALFFLILLAFCFVAVGREEKKRRGKFETLVSYCFGFHVN